MSVATEYLAVGRLDGNELVRQHSPMVHRIAHQLRGKMSPNVELADIIQAGMVGLLEAARNYRASAGASFETWATIRIRGAMVDELRRHDWTPRSISKKVRELVTETRKVEIENGGVANDAEVMRRLGMDADQYHGLIRDALGVRVIHFSTADTEEESKGVLSVPDDEGVDPLTAAERHNLIKVLVDTLPSLPEREQLVLSFYYEHELNLKEIGAILQVTESRVSQLHGQALVRIRARMMDLPEPSSRRGDKGVGKRMAR